MVAEEEISFLAGCAAAGGGGRRLLLLLSLSAFSFVVELLVCLLLPVL